MFNIILNHNEHGYIQKFGIFKMMDEKVDNYLNSVCLTAGATLEGHINGSRELLPNTKKVPIYVSSIDDYLIPLTSPSNDDCIWMSAKNFLTCYEVDGLCHIKFKDRSSYIVSFSEFTIRMQYRKYLELEEKRNEMKVIYEI